MGPRDRFMAVTYEQRLISFGVTPRTARFASKVYDAKRESGELEKFFGKSLFLFGSCGCGKTTLAALSMLFHVDEYHCSPERRAAGRTLKFITLPELLFELRQSIKGTQKGSSNDRNFEENLSAEEKLIRLYQAVDVLVLDDFGAEKTTDWTLTMLYLILAHRYEYNKITILTSNLSLDDLTKQFGDARLTSRIGGWCSLVEMKGTDKRSR